LFTSGDRDEDPTNTESLQKISVTEYFLTKYKRKLQYPHLPCIDGVKGMQKKANWLPMEIVTVSISTEYFITI
jgi:hypothetical protein